MWINLQVSDYDKFLSVQSFKALHMKSSVLSRGFGSVHKRILDAFLT